MQDESDSISVADILGPWADPDWESGLIDRCRKAWNKPLRDLQQCGIEHVLRQRVAVEYLLPIATKRVQHKVDDETEIYDGELEAAIAFASKTY